MRPLYPKLASELYRVSPFGICRQIVGRFDRTNTIVRLSQDLIPDDLLKRIRQSELRQLVKKLTYPDYYEDSKIITLVENNVCSLRAAQELRFHTWFVDLLGVTIPVPTEQWKISRVVFPLPIQGGVLVHTSELVWDPAFKFWKLPGPFKQYLGSGTKERVLKNYFSTLPPTELHSQLKRTLELMAWSSYYHSPGLVSQLKDALKIILSTVHENSNMAKFDQWLSSHETNIYSGCIEHRLSSAFSSQAILYNTLSTISTHFKFNTSSLGYEFRTNDYTIVFQSLFLSTVSRVCLQKNNRSEAARAVFDGI